MRTDETREYRSAWETQLSRRALMRWTAFGTITAATASLLAACGGDDDDDADSSDDDATTVEEEGSTSGDAPTATSAADEPADVTEPESEPETEDEPTPTESAESDLPGATLTIRNRGEIVNLDPHLGAGNPDSVISTNIYSRLVMTYPNASVEPVPDLATSWEVSDDGLEYTFLLREGVQWHKGYGEVTAADVVWTYDRVRDPDLGSRSTGEFAGVSEVIADDDYTVRIILSEPDPTFLYAVLARVGSIGNQRAIEEKGDGYTSDPVGSGPYIFEEWVRGEQAVLVKNEGHWLHEGNVERVIFKFLTDDTVTELAMRSGDLDMAYVETPQAQQAIIGNEELNALTGPAPRTHMIWFSMKEDLPTADVRVRRALAISINRELLAEEAMDGMAQPAHSVFNPTLAGYLDTEFFPYDPEQATQLLAEAGFEDGIEFDFLGYTSGVSPDLIAVVAAQWQEIGVTANVNILERALLYERWQNRDFEVLEQPAAREIPEPLIYPFFTTAGIPWPNAGHYTAIDDLAEQLRSEQDPVEREKLYMQIQERLAEDIPVIPTVYPQLVLGMRPGISEFPIDIWYYPLWLMSVTE